MYLGLSQIIKLSEHLSNLIAAGEVVENPYSVVKELIENSLDATSTYVEINLLESGMKKIEVIDNGFGMTKEDAQMAFLRHATSKIKTEFDLYRISSLGFRGEAIPSIASVSEFIMRTKKMNDEGYQITYKAGKKISEQAVAMNKGTHITINNLFYNTPARLKYIKSLSTELTNVINLIEKEALSHPEVFFKLTHDGKVVFQTNGSGDVKSVLNQIYGLDVFKHLLPVDASFDNINLQGFISDNNLYKSRNSFITLFVNKRLVRSKEIFTAITEAYQEFIPASRYPLVVLYLKIDPMLFDVNVSPAKTEIKFANEKALSSFITKVVKETITQSLKKVFNEISKPNILEYQKIDFKESPVEKEKPKETFDKSYNLFTYESPVIKEDNAIYLSTDNLSYIGQYMGTYLLFQNESGLILFDQHAVAERIKYEYYLKKLAADNQLRQELLIPLNLEFPASQFHLIKEHSAKIQNLGFIFEESGPKSFFLREVPLYLLHEDLDETIERLINFILGQKDFKIIDIIDETAKIISCKNSVKANKFLTNAEAISLLDDLNKCETPYFCPHGRPTYIRLTQIEIEKLFKRMV